MKNFMSLPSDLPVPQDDGLGDHLVGTLLPNIILKGTSGVAHSLRDLTKSPTVIFFYPRTGEADVDTPDGWDAIPGARGCTPQSCGFRDLYLEFKKMGFQIFGLSTQSTPYQLEFLARMHIPFEILSDEKLELTHKMKLPNFIFQNKVLIKRMAWVISEGRIVKLFYPVFPTNQNADSVLAWIKSGKYDEAKKRNYLASAPLIEKSREGYFLSNEKNLLNPEFVFQSLKRTHWASNRSLEAVETSVKNSDVYAIYLNKHPVAFARVVTDYATFAYLCDVFVAEEERGKGHSKWLMETIMASASYQKLRRFVLATLDAHSLYARYGFELLSKEAAERFMEIRKNEF